MAQEDDFQDESCQPTSGKERLVATACATFGVVLHLALALAGAGLLVRLTVRDRLLVPGVIFYATPCPLLVIIALAGAIWHWARRRLRFAVPLAVIAVAVAGAWYSRSHVSAVPAPAEETVRLMFWNAARLRHDIEPVIQHVRSQQPDFVALVEAELETKRQRRLVHEAFPDYEVLPLPAGMLLLSRFPVESTGHIKVRDGGDVNLVKLLPRGKPVTLAIVDIESSPLYNRGDAIADVFKEIGRAQTVTRIVVGDFNTPSESVHFGPDRRRWRHAFEEAGQGFMETWPWGIPLLAIDHIWLQGPLRAVECSQETVWCSDHQSVITELALEPSGAQQPAAP